MAIIFADLARQHVDAVLRALQPLRGADDADIIPHEAADLGPVLLDDDFLVRIGDAAFVPRADRGRRFERVPARDDVLRRRLAEDETFEQAVRRSEEHTSELQSLMRISYAVFCLKKKNNKIKTHKT